MLSHGSNHPSLVIETAVSESYQDMPRKHLRSRAVRKKVDSPHEVGPYELLDAAVLCAANSQASPSFNCLNARCSSDPKIVTYIPVAI